MARGTVLVTGGAGYVGSALVPRLLASGYEVRVLDLYLYGEAPLAAVRGSPGLTEIRGDIRRRDLVDGAMAGCDAVIHLACISNDPSFDLDPTLGRSINLDAFAPLVESARSHRVRRFVYASSSSVYGVKAEPEVTENASLEPLTDYSRFKAECERLLAEFQSPAFTTVVLRPATVCGYAPRQRLDVIVNMLVHHAVERGRIRVFGGAQKRPNIHIEDMVDAYLLMLSAPAEAIAGQVYNVGGENFSVLELAEKVRAVAGRDVPLSIEPTSDPRSYHIASGKIARQLGFRAQRTVEEAIRDLLSAFESGLLPDASTDARYHNVRMMKAVALR